MTSQRKRKKEASSKGLTLTELELLEMIEEMLEAMRWMQILGYSNQFLLNQKLNVDHSERNRVVEAATRAVDKDGKLYEWKARLARIKGEALRVERTLADAQQQAAADSPDPDAEEPREEAQSGGQ